MFLTVEGISYPTGTLVQHINVVFLSPSGSSCASSAVCVSRCENVCVCVCVSPPLSVSDFVSDGVCPTLHIDLQRRVCVCRYVCVRLCPFKTHADQPQLQPSMMHLPPQPVAMGGHLPCVFFFINLSLIFCYSTSSLFVFTNLL